MKLKNIWAVTSIAVSRLYWCVKKGFPIRIAMFDIPFKEIPASTRFGHPYGITIAPGTKLGERCVFMANVTIGLKHLFEKEPAAIIGDEVIFGTGCTVLGGVRIGNRCVISAGAVVLESFPEEGSVIVGNPAKIRYREIK